MKKLLVLLMICCMCTACGTKEEAAEVRRRTKEMKFREILPKLQMDPAGDLYNQMQSGWQAELAELKKYFA